MVQLVSLPKQRELLYRLSLIGRQFGRKEVEIVARVHPAVDSPGEPLGELVGPWINKFSDESYEISPLLSDAGRRYLTTDLQGRIHHALASGILRQGRITTTEGFYAAMHLSSAEDWPGVATLLIHILISVRTSEHAHDVDWAVFLFGKWPDSIPSAFRLMLRGLQVKVARLSGNRMADQLDTDLDQLLLAAGGRPDEQLATVMALLNAGPLLETAPAAKATRRALVAVRLIRDHPELFAGLELKAPIMDLLWLPAARALNLVDVRSISAVLDDMSTEELREAFKSDLALQACEFLADRCWLSMDARRKEEQDWDAVLQVLGQLENLAQRRGLEELRCMALQARAVVFTDYLGRGEEGLQLLRDAGEPQNPDCRFFVRYRIARILDDLGRTGEAIDEYEHAIASGGREFVYLRFRAYIEATVACGRAGNWDRAALWARGGLAFASSYPRASFREFQVH
jgi:tetratricopeptide (TPR) repeat protein